ncbi:MAG: PA3496 family putative envelope integrity protein [Pseudomonadales bacterium]|jgi:hypothetical protein
MARKRQKHEPEQLPEQELLPDEEDIVEAAAATGDELETIDELENVDEGGAEEDSANDTGSSGFSAAIGDDSLDEFDDSDVDLKVVDEVLSHKDQNARALAIRRAIEERLEARRLSHDLDYLDAELED